MSKVQPDLDNAAGIESWQVDINHADKILTVQSAGITHEEVVALIRKKGFVATPA